MSEELVKRLRDGARVFWGDDRPTGVRLLTEEAADAIEQLTMERNNDFQDYVEANEARIEAETRIKVLEKALRCFADAWDSLPTGNYPPKVVNRWLYDRMKPAADAARAVLGVEEKTSDE